MPINSSKSQNILKILLCMGIAYINIFWIFHISTVITFDVTPKNKIDFVKNWLYVKMSIFTIIFLLFFLTRLKTMGNFLLLTLKRPTRFTFLPKKLLMNKTGALLVSLNVVVYTKKNIHHCKTNTFIVSLRI